MKFLLENPKLAVARRSVALKESIWLRQDIVGRAVNAASEVIMLEVVGKKGRAPKRHKRK